MSNNLGSLESNNSVISDVYVINKAFIFYGV